MLFKVNGESEKLAEKISVEQLGLPTTMSSVL